jgi:hypothetical protein
VELDIVQDADRLDALELSELLGCLTMEDLKTELYDLILSKLKMTKEEYKRVIRQRLIIL